MTSDSRFVPHALKLSQAIMKPSFPVIALAAMICFSSTGFAQKISTDPADIKAGEALFNANCKTCHRIHEKLIGPALEDAYDRVPSIQWIKNFVHNSAAVIAGGDDYAVKRFNEFNKTQMTQFGSTISDDQIMQIIAYVKQETDHPTNVAQTPPPGGEQNPGGGSGVPQEYLNAIIIGMVLILVLIALILVFMVSTIKRLLDQKDLTPEDREVVRSPYTFSSITRSKGFIFIVTFLVFALVAKAVINGLYSIGIQQGYSPTQPIAFSHKIHAGDNQIDCKYCHTGAMKSKNATIPSLNICMNCHRAVKTESPEIQKLWLATDWQAETNTIGPNARPIEWIRIHNLPDLAYFNHSQHVVVGNIQCQTCHGPIETMDQVSQYSLLTMGWCIDCHRKTEVNSKGNVYYDSLVEIHKRLDGDTPMTVEDIGGTECSNCHY